MSVVGDEESEPDELVEGFLLSMVRETGRARKLLFSNDNNRKNQRNEASLARVAKDGNSLDNTYTPSTTRLASPWPVFRISS